MEARRHGVQEAQEPSFKGDPWVRRCYRHLRRRGADIFGVANVVGVLSTSHCVVVPRAIASPYLMADLVPVLSASWQILLLLFLAHWAAVVCYGPGRPGQKSVLPSALQQLFEAGQQLPRPLSADAFCKTCEAEKPCLASHCSQCNKCCLWMDHHCNFFGQCVGFRNLRCFIVALLYGNVMCAYLVAITFLLDLPDSWMGWALLLSWTVYILWWWNKVFHFFRCACWEVVTGWRSSVLRMKLSQLQLAAYSQGAEWRLEREGDDQLQRAFSGVILTLWESTHPLGIFLEPGAFGKLGAGTEQFAGVFGSQPSLAWLLPFSGGNGDPLQPQGVSTKSCEAWLQLAAAVRSGSIA